MKKIPLTKGYVAIVDDEDYNELSKHKWCADNSSKTNVYALRRVGKKLSRMHNEIIGRKDGLEIDHINGNGLDNRRANLRFCTRSQNRMNGRKNADNTSGYKGVTKSKKSPNNPWHAHIKFNGITKHLGNYKTKEDAARAYDAAAKELHGEFCSLNFPS